MSADIVGSTERDSLSPARAESGPLTDAITELERCRYMLASGEGGAELAGLLARAEALVAAARGSWQESESQFIKAVETFRRHKMAWQEAHTFQTWGRTLLAGVDRRGLIEKLDSAIEVYRRQSAGEERIHGVDDSARNLDTGVSGVNSRTTIASALPEALFRPEGDYWTVSWQGNLVRLKDAKGFHYLAYLLANPGREMLAQELALLGAATGKGRASAGPDRSAATLGDAGAMLDTRACEQYRKRIGELREELTEADRLNDGYRATRLRCELESLGDQLVAAVGLGGRFRKAASHSERARLMVTKAIKAAIAKIRGRDVALGHHLATSIKTGNFCIYDPGPDRPTAWQL
jgi:hypothetical protein